MANVKYGMAGRYLTTAQQKELEARVMAKAKEELRQEIIKEVMERNQEIFDAQSEDSIYFHTVLYAYALHSAFGFGEDRLFRTINKVADLMDEVNEGKFSLEEAERTLAKKGITLVKTNIEKEKK